MAIFVDCVVRRSKYLIYGGARHKFMWWHQTMSRTKFHSNARLELVDLVKWTIEAYTKAAAEKKVIVDSFQLRDVQYRGCIGYERCRKNNVYLLL